MSAELLQFSTIGEPGTEPPLLVVHGLFGSGRNWGILSKRLAADRQVVTVDMRNHGASFHATDHSYFDMADDLARVIEHIGRPATVLGHSMGGKAAMVLALKKPELVDRLIVADIAPVAYTHSPQDNIAAMRAVDLSSVTRRGEADAQLQALVPEPSQRAFLLQSLSLRDNAARWSLNLDALDRAMPAIVGFPEIGGRFDGASLFLYGGDSNYVQPRYHEKIRDLFPNALLEELPGAGHWLHAEKPQEFLAAVQRFLQENPS